VNDDLHSRLHALGDSPDLNRPLDDLDVVVRRARARRQRSGRMLAGGVAVALVVVGAAGAVPRLSDDSQPAVDTVSPNAPAACLLTPDELASDDLGVLWPVREDGTVPTDLEVYRAAATIDPASVVPASEGTWRLTTSIDAIPGPTVDIAGPPTGWTYGTTVALVQDAVVVAVLDTYPAPTRAEAAMTEVDVVPQTFPIDTEVEAVPISCRTGDDAELAPGTYEVIASTTAGLADGDGSGEHDVMRATSAPLEVNVSEESVSAGPVACGATDDALRALADPQANPQPLVLSADEPGDEVTEGSPHSFPVTVTNDSPDEVTVQTTTPVVVVTQGGKIVGGLDRVDSGSLVMGIPPGVGSEVGASSELRSCTSGDEQRAALPPGDYELWVTMSFTPIGPDGLPLSDAEDWQAAGGPWPLEITPAPDAAHEPAVTTLTCGTATDELATLAAEPSTLTLTPAEPFDADTMAVRITNEGDERVTFTTSSVTSGVARADRIVGVGPGQDLDSAPTVLEPGKSEVVSAGGPPDGAECDGELPAGPYDGWVMVTVVLDGVESPLVSGPTEVTLDAGSGDIIDGFRCGASDHMLRSSSPLGTDSDVEIAPIDMPATVPSGEWLTFDLRLTNNGDASATGVGSYPTLYIVQGGIIVATDDVLPMSAGVGPIDPGGHVDAVISAPMTACAGPGAPLPLRPLPAGDYDVFVSTMELSGGPWPLEITAP
jgi:hypothetical protein